jgi:hypothetical protein
MNRQEKNVTKRATLCAVIFCLTAAAAQAADVDELTRATQNPIAHLISVPFQNNVHFGIGPFDRNEYVLNVEPVVPFRLGPVSFASRTIIPVKRQPDVIAEAGATAGLGDVSATLFASPSTSGKVIWGAGPVVVLPTASDELGYGKWCVGPSAVVLAQPGRWTTGVLLENVWSVAGDEGRADVNGMLAQPFVTYNFDHGWHVATSPQIVANWKADAADRWLVPAGGGVAKLLRFGKLPVNAGVHGYYYVVHPENLPYPEWTLRAVATFFFPGI